MLNTYFGKRGHDLVHLNMMDKRISHHKSVKKGIMRAAIYASVSRVYVMYFRGRDYLGFIMKVRPPHHSLLCEEGAAEEMLERVRFLSPAKAKPENLSPLKEIQ